jgi:MacB-like periplasmic core domain
VGLFEWLLRLLPLPMRRDYADAAVAILSHGLWSRRFGSDPTIIGRSVSLNGVPMDIVGVMPPSFAFPDSRVGVWIPEPLTRSAGFGLFTHVAIARLRDGASIADARTDMDAIIAGLPQSFPCRPTTSILAIRTSSSTSGLPTPTSRARTRSVSASPRPGPRHCPHPRG